MTVYLYDADDLARFNTALPLLIALARDKHIDDVALQEFLRDQFMTVELKQLEVLFNRLSEQAHVAWKLREWRQDHEFAPRGPVAAPPVDPAGLRSVS